MVGEKSARVWDQKFHSILGGAWFHLWKDCDKVLVKDYFAIVTAELANSYQVVLGGGHHFGIAAWELGEAVCLGS